MVEINPLSTLFVGIDVSSKNNVVYAMDFNQHKAFSSSFANSQPGAEQLEKRLEQFMLAHQNLDTIVVAMEATSV